MNNVIATVGISGSGKSTWRHKFCLANPDYTSICPDQIRKELTGSISNQSKNAEVWEEAYERLQRTLSCSKNVVFDSTCTNLNTVKALINFSENKNAKIFFKIIYCDPDTAACRVNSDIINNVDRSCVPRDVIQRQYEGFLKVVKWLKENNKNIIED